MYRVLLLTALLVALAMRVAPAQAPDSYSDDARMPEGVLGDRVRSVLNTLNAPTPEAVRRFMEGECTKGFRGLRVDGDARRHLRVPQPIHRRCGFHSIRSYTPERPRETVAGGTPATQDYSTVGDLHRFALALLDGTLVSGTSLEVMWRRYGEGDGYGFQVDERPIGVAVGHTGGSWGASSHLTIYPESGHTVVALSNYRTGASPLVERIEQLIERTR